MRTKSIILLAFFLPSVCLADWPPSIDFYTDGIIQDGNAFDVVRLFDDATVDMTGGIIQSSLELYNTSIFNADGGSMNVLLGGASRIALFDTSVINLHKLDGGVAYGVPLTAIESAGGSDTQINFYGYGFQFEGVILSGYWADGSQFVFTIRSNEETMEALVFHEIPEPATLMMFITGVFCITGKISHKK